MNIQKIMTGLEKTGVKMVDDAKFQRYSRYLQNNNKDELLLLKKALYKLKEREKNILMERFFVGKTQMELAKTLNISQAQVSRIEKSALKNMRKLMK